MPSQRKPKHSPAEVKSMIGGGQKLLVIATALVDAILGVPGGTVQDVDRLSKPEGASILKQMAAVAVRKAAEPILQVAYALVLPWIIAACRFVSNVDQNITAEHFPLMPDDLRIKEVKVVKSGRSMSTPDALKWLDVQGRRPATLLELLFWWLTNPDAQKDCLVVALGQTWNGGVAYVDVDGDGGRQLDLGEVAGGRRRLPRRPTDGGTPRNDNSVTLNS